MAEQKKKTNHLLIIGLLLTIFLIVLGTLFLKMAKENNKCNQDPLVYGMEKVSEIGVDFYCSCNPLDPTYQRFEFDKDGYYFPESLDQKIDYNVTDFIENFNP